MGHEEHLKQEGWCGYEFNYVSVIFSFCGLPVGRCINSHSRAQRHLRSSSGESGEKTQNGWTSSLQMNRMSRRRVSVKDLGLVDCQGWLHRRKEGRTFLGSRWKKYWFVLKKSSLYWYTDMMAEKAEGFINLAGFSIEPAKQCRKKHALTASHPQVVTICVAAENFTDMNKWISKLSEAAEPSGLIDTEECYSEDSEQDTDEWSATSCSLSPEVETAECQTADLPLDSCEPPSCTPAPGSRRRSTSEGATLCRNRRGKKGSEGNERLSWLDLPKAVGEDAGVEPPLVHMEEIKEEGAQGKHLREKPSDEMESLYIHLKAARLSPLGQSGQKDFRASFIRRCSNVKVNEKLHLLRILSSTLKARESDLLAVEQILTDSSLTAPQYRKWRTSNSILLQEIRQKNQAAGGAAELQPPEQPTREHSPDIPTLVETQGH